MKNTRYQSRLRILAARLPVPPVPFLRAEGSWVFGTDGRRYLDASSGLVCVNLGHAHPRIIQAMTEQVARGAFASPGAVEDENLTIYAAEIARAVHRPDDLVVFGVTGTSAIEMAINLARSVQRARGSVSKHRILTSSLSFHGNSAFTLALSGHRRRRPHPDDSFGLGPAFDAPYAGHHAQCQNSTCTAECADDIASVIDADDSNTVAAVLIEPINGATGGAFTPPPGYLKRVREICAARGVLLIHDEVLTGMGRTGLPLAAHHSPGGNADITVLSKGLGAGYLPVSAVLIAPDVADDLLSSGANRPLMGTMSATPMQASVGMSVLAELRNIGALRKSKVRGLEVAETLQSAVENQSVVVELRGCGFFYGIELSNGLQQRAMEISRKNGLLLYPFNGFRPDGGGEGVVVAPPLNVDAEEIEFLGESIHATLSALSRESDGNER